MLKNVQRTLMLIFLITSVNFAQSTRPFGAQVEGSFHGTTFGLRGWVSHVGYAAGLGTDWEFEHFSGTAKLMYAPMKTKNLYLVFGAGYTGFKANGFEGNLTTFGIGIGTEWSIGEKVSTALDIGYNFKGSLDYEISGFHFTHKIPYWISGSAIYYF